ncbi:hypothetical protein GGR54DRAFT_624800 [Hypoxylon sp. NC1633]|nr:hypothetical protein GGR54DRAFT_624800 [Hypoxylon sp. NC1633]
MRSLKEAGVGDGYAINIESCLAAVVQHTKADMEILLYSDVVNWMEVYYKVALKEVVDDFSKLAIEACLVSKLPELFTPEIVYKLSKDAVYKITAESPEKAEERRYLTEKREILTSGMTELQRLSKHHQRFNDTEDEGNVESASEVVTMSRRPRSSSSEQFTPSEAERSQSPAYEIIAAPKSEIIEEESRGDDVWGTIGRVRKDEKKKGSSVDLPPSEPGPINEPKAPDSWDFGIVPATKKSKKKKKVVNLPASPEDEAPTRMDDDWGLFGVQNKKKAKEEEPVLQLVSEELKEYY